MDLEPPSLLLISLISITEQLSISEQITRIVILIILLLCSALISGTEVAFFSLSATDFDDGSPEKELPKRLTIVKNLLSKPKKLLATILVANNFINIAIVLLFASLSDLFFLGINTVFYGVSLQFILKVGLVTFLILLFGEILPKIYASRNNLSFSLFMAYPIKILDTVLSPISNPMQLATKYVQRKLGKQRSNISVDHLSQALELTSDEDTTHEEHKILKGIVTFGNTDTKEVMKPRMDIFALQEDMEYKDIVPQIIKNGYSRIPVFKESIDRITGILYVKDLMPHIDKEEFNWKRLLRNPYYVPENKKLDDLLNEFKKMKMHLAIVVDEYGGTSGLISLEDIIEEIVGEISDEFDDEDLIFSKIDDTTFIFEGKTSLKDFYKVIKLEDPILFEEVKGDADTLAGLLLEISKGFPKKGEIILFNHYSFTIEGFENKRINQIKLSIIH